MNVLDNRKLNDLLDDGTTRASYLVSICEELSRVASTSFTTEREKAIALEFVRGRVAALVRAIGV